MHHITSEIISSEITSWDSTIRVYKKCVEFLTDIKAYYSNNDEINAHLESKIQELAKLKNVYAEIYTLIGDSTKEFLSSLGVPDPQLIQQLNNGFTQEQWQAINSQLRFKASETEKIVFLAEGTSKPQACIVVDEESKNLLISHALLNMIGCEQFFKLCELRKSALLEYSDFVKAITFIIENLPISFHHRTNHKYKFDGPGGFEIDAAAILQRFVKYKLFGADLLKKLPEEDRSSSLYYIGEILSRLGCGYASWDNIARHIKEKADPRHVITNDDQYRLLATYRKSALTAKEEIEKSIRSLELKIKGLEGPTSSMNDRTAEQKTKKMQILHSLKSQLISDKELQKVHEKRLQDITKQMGQLIKDNIIVAKEAETSIRFARTEASVLIQLMYQELKIPVISFERNIPIHQQYQPEPSIRLEETPSVSSPKSPRSPRFRLRTRTVEEAGPSESPESPKLMKSFIDNLVGNLRDGAQNVKSTLKKSPSNRSFVITRTEVNKKPVDMIFSKSADNSPRGETSQQKSFPASSSQKPAEPYESGGAPGSTADFSKGSSVVERFYAQLQQQPTQSKKMIEDEELAIESNVRDKIRMIENLVKDGEILHQQLNKAEKGRQKLEIEYNHFIKAQTSLSSQMTKPMQPIGHPVEKPAQLGERMRARTAEPPQPKQKTNITQQPIRNPVLKSPQLGERTRAFTSEPTKSSQNSNQAQQPKRRPGTKPLPPTPKPSPKIDVMQQPGKYPGIRSPQPAKRMQIPTVESPPPSPTTNSSQPTLPAALRSQQLGERARAGTAPCFNSPVHSINRDKQDKAAGKNYKIPPSFGKK